MIDRVGNIAFLSIKHHPRGLTEAYQENSCQTPAPRHTLPACAGRYDDGDVISLTRLPVNNPNPAIQSERVVVLWEKDESHKRDDFETLVAINHGLSLLERVRGFDGRYSYLHFRCVLSVETSNGSNTFAVFLKGSGTLVIFRPV